jgi:hypothetical protein
MPKARLQSNVRQGYSMKAQGVVLVEVLKALAK